MMKPRVCELCNGEASLYCVSDSAFLCWNCDVKVHEANFLVARHIRLTVCCKCNEFDGNRRSGIGFKPFEPICISCSSESDNDDNNNNNFVSSSSNLSSDCISTTAESAEPKMNKIYGFDRIKSKKIACSSSVSEVSGVDSCLPVILSGEYSSEKKTVVRSRRVHAKNVDLKAEGILVNWCRKMGLIKEEGGSCSVLPVALQAFGVCLDKFTVLPFRVALASSLWYSLKVCEGGRGRLLYTCQIKRIEKISGVPAKLIILGESKISRVLNLNRRSQFEGDDDNQQEGWAECCD